MKYDGMSIDQQTYTATSHRLLPTDDVVGAPLLEIEADGAWILAEEGLWSSWTGRRLRNGEEYHGPVYLLGTQSRWTGPRICGCPTCQQWTEPAYRPN